MSVSLVFGEELATCNDDRPFHFKFFPTVVGSVKLHEKMDLSGKCFKNISFELVERNDYFVLMYEMREKNSWLCGEIMILTTGRTQKYDFGLVEGYYSQTYLKTDLTEEEAKHIRRNGIRVLLSCNNYSNLFQDYWMTFKLFFGGYFPPRNDGDKIKSPLLPKYMINENIKFVKGWTGYEWKWLDKELDIKVPKEEIKSGTMVGAFRFDGFDTAYQVMSGSRIGQTAIALWRDNELYIVETQFADHWTDKGVQAHLWEDWLALARDASYNLVLLPLKDEYQSKFNQEAVWSWYEQNKNIGYGNNNTIYAWLDTVGKNLPEFLNTDLFVILTKLLLYNLKDLDLFVLQAINKRLDSECKDLDDVWEELYKKDMTIEELLAIPEQDKWLYNGRPSLTSSAFIASIYKQAGLFGDLEVNATEFTGKDLYELEFFDISGEKVAESCKESAPRGYCQLMGKIDMDLGELAFQAVYAHMNEKCPTVRPDYRKVLGC